MKKLRYTEEQIVGKLIDSPARRSGIARPVLCPHFGIGGIDTMFCFLQDSFVAQGRVVLFILIHCVF